MILNVLDFASPQSAFDASAEGDRVYFPSGQRHVCPTGGWRIRHGLEVFGDGPGTAGSTSASVILTAGPSDDVFVLDPPDPPPQPPSGPALFSELSHMSFR